MNNVHYNVSGLLNEQIKTQLKNVLNDMDGVNSINVDLGQSSIEVGFNDNITQDTIVQCIERVGCKID